MTTSMQRAKKIRNNEAIEELGLTFYPILMRDYDEFLSCKDVIELRMASLPVKYLPHDYITALFKMEMDAVNSEDKSNRGILFKFMVMLYLSLRIDIQSTNIGETIFYKEDNGNYELAYITITQNGETVELKPRDISSKIRPLIAEMNGLELPDEAQNLDILRDAEEAKRFHNRGKAKLKISTDDLLASVAYQNRIRIKDLNEWTVREFALNERAIARDKCYMLYTKAELSGEIKNNPYRSWCFDTTDDNYNTVDFEAFKKQFNSGQ